MIRDALMWRPSAGVKEHQVFLSRNRPLVEAGDPTTLKGVILNGENVFYIPEGFLAEGRRYYWRIDGGLGEQAVRGDIWEFKTL